VEGRFSLGRYRPWNEIDFGRDPVSPDEIANRMLRLEA
jgi:hypothetical protein